MPPSPDKTQRLTKKSFVSRSTIETFFIKIKLDKALFSVPPGQQPHFFDSRLTYHASRSAMVGAMGAGYPLSQNWGYNNYSSYLGYNTGAATLPGYTQPAISSYPTTLDPVLPTNSSETTPTSPNGKPFLLLSDDQSFDFGFEERSICWIFIFLPISDKIFKTQNVD